MAQRARGVPAAAGPAARRGAGGDARQAARAGADLAAIRSRLRAVVEPLVVQAGLDLEDLTVRRAGRRHLVRVTVDGDGGVGHDELSNVSHDISAALDAAEASGEELTPGAYTLEVSSPGVDRPLTLPRHWRRNIGRLVTVRVGDRTITARVAGADDSGVVLAADSGQIRAAYDDLGPGRVQVEFSRIAELDDDLEDADHMYEDRYGDATGRGTSDTELDSGAPGERRRVEEEGA